MDGNRQPRNNDVRTLRTARAPNDHLIEAVEYWFLILPIFMYNDVSTKPIIGGTHNEIIRIKKRLVRVQMRAERHENYCFRA